MSLLETINNQAKTGTYMSGSLSSDTTDAIKKYINDNNLKKNIDINDLHVTIIYSRKYVAQQIALGKFEGWEATFDGFELFGERDEILVMKLKCEQLVTRHHQVRNEYGATHDFDEYNPHISIAHDSEDVDITTLPAFTGPIVIVEETQEKLKP